MNMKEIKVMLDDLDWHQELQKWYNLFDTDGVGLSFKYGNPIDHDDETPAIPDNIREIIQSALKTHIHLNDKRCVVCDPNITTRDVAAPNIDKMTNRDLLKGIYTMLLNRY